MSLANYCPTCAYCGTPDQVRAHCLRVHQYAMPNAAAEPPATDYGNCPQCGEPIVLTGHGGIACTRWWRTGTHAAAEPPAHPLDRVQDEIDAAEPPAVAPEVALYRCTVCAFCSTERDAMVQHSCIDHLVSQPRPAARIGARTAKAAAVLGLSLQEVEPRATADSSGATEALEVLTPHERAVLAYWRDDDEPHELLAVVDRLIADHATLRAASERDAGLLDVVSSLIYAAPETRAMWFDELVEAWNARQATATAQQATE